MIKYLAFLINASLISFLGFFINDNVSVVMNVPSDINPGDEFVVELQIDKGDIDGFAKIQLDLPEGMLAEDVDANGGQFSFNDGKVKILLWNLPTEQSFDVKFKVKVSPSFTGEINLEGKFSYIVDNERQVVSFTQQSSNKPTEIVDNSTDNNTNQENTQQYNNSDNSTVTNNTENNTQQNTETIEPTSNVVISTRRIVAPKEINAGDELTVSITINKGNLSGFAKIQDNLFPMGFQAKEVESKGGKFSISDNKVKLLWMNLPSEPEFTISYKLIASSDINGEFTLDKGVFSYVVAGASKPVNHQIEAATFKVNGTEIAVNTPDEPEVKQTNDSENKEDIIETASTEIKTDNIPTSPKPVEGINYRVQICATHQKVDASYFVKNNNVSEEIFMELHEGWTKFTVGNFSKYSSARDHRETARSQYNIVGPFVTAYNDGSRITVQEALMLSQQKWVP